MAASGKALAAASNIHAGLAAGYENEWCSTTESGPLV